MGFLEQFSVDEQGALRSCAQTIALGPGAALFRQHDRSRDIYVLEDGVLEVVDTSGSSPIILRTFPKGELVGEISFLNEHAHRTAEVRARDAVRLLKFDYQRTIDFLKHQPVIAAKFYRSLAVALAQRTQAASSMALASRAVEDRPSVVLGVALQTAVDELLRRVADLEGLLDTPGNPAGAELHSALDAFGARFTELVGNADPRQSATPVDDARARLRPVLGRSTTVSGCLRATHAADAAVVRHVLAGVPSGERALGEVVDRWLLERPTFRAMRERDAMARQLLVEWLPASPPWTVGILNPISAGLVESVADLLAPGGGNVWTMLDVQDSALEAGIHGTFLTRGAGRVRHRPLTLDTVALATGALHPPPVALADLVIVDGLVEYLPDRLAFAILRAARAHVRPEGRLVVTWLDQDPSDDTLLAHLLRWPVVRRDASETRRFLEDAGIVDVHVHTVAPRGGLVSGTQPSSPGGVRA
jgi:CRP-like cAMP-binding protein